MRYPVEETAAKHERIVKEASRLFRERGFENVSVGEVMKAAGLTHGAFYAHFGSKEELQAAAVAYGQKVSLGRLQRSKKKEEQRIVCRPVPEPVAPRQSRRRLHHGRAGPGGGSLDP